MMYKVMIGYNKLVDVISQWLLSLSQPRSQGPLLLDE